MLDAGGGRVRMMTLAPELDEGLRLTSHLASQGILVSGGHANPSLSQLRRAIDAGLSMWTHLGNGSPGLLPRHDNIVQRVLSFCDDLTITFIADGHHVPLFALRNYIRCMPLDRVVIVSDAMLAAGLGPGSYRFADQTVTVDLAGAAWCEDGTHLAGSAFTMRQMETVLRTELNATDRQVAAWLTENPKRLLALPDPMASTNL
jgi:N-acetylglucosamine-6-phosphate deacetylase